MLVNQELLNSKYASGENEDVDVDVDVSTYEKQ